MLMRPNSDPTSRFDSDAAKKIAECDDVSHYQEAGWYCITGWKFVHGERRRHVHVHFGSREEYENFVNPKPSIFDGRYHGLRYG